MAAALACRSTASTETRAARCAAGSPNTPSMILAQAPSALMFWTNSATAGSPQSIAQDSSIRALRSELIMVHTA